MVPSFSSVKAQDFFLSEKDFKISFERAIGVDAIYAYETTNLPKLKFVLHLE